MPDEKYLTPEQVAARYGISEGTLRNWRSSRKFGPAYLKIGKLILYRARDLDAWDEKNLVICDASKSHREEALP